MENWPNENRSQADPAYNNKVIRNDSVIDAIDGSFVPNPPAQNTAIFEEFDEHYLLDGMAGEYGIIGYEMINSGDYHKIWFKNRAYMLCFFEHYTSN